MKRSGAQYKLFDERAELPNGLIYRPHFITALEEEMLVAFIEQQHMKRARAGDYVGNRRVKGFGWGWDEEKQEFIPGGPLPTFLQRFARKIAKWLHIPKDRVVEALINEYRPGSGVGWHRDNEGFEHVVGISLSGWCTMRFRPLQTRGATRRVSDVISLELEPRSVYVMQGKVRWDYQHSVAPTRTLRQSITFRTLPTNEDLRA